MSLFESLGIRGAVTTTDASTGLRVFPAVDPHALIQAAGYLKYALGSTANAGVYFRGQSRLYPLLSPTLFRGCSSSSAQGKRSAKLNRVLEQAIDGITLLGKPSALVVEPLLQHYGIRTSWLDIVDNIWVALWFACHHARGTGKFGEYVHFEQRQPRREAVDNRYAYILLIQADLSGVPTDVPGYWRSEISELVDLRIATPSIFLRPHAQHGLLFRLRGDSVRRPVDYSSAVAGTIRVPLDDALEWLGSGSLLSTHSLFPPPSYDGGYQILLNDWPTIPQPFGNVVGTIAHIGA